MRKAIKEAVPETQEETIASLKAELAAAQAIIDKVKIEKEGWLVIAPNAAYGGTQFGTINFDMGMTFIPKGKVVPYFCYELSLPQQKLSEDEQARILESHRALSSERCVMNLKSDFGYRVQYFTADQSDLLDQAITEQKAKARIAINNQSEAQRNLRFAFQERGTYLGITRE